MILKNTDLFEKALIEPPEQANKLYIVSGYATAMMAMRHIEYAKISEKKLLLPHVSKRPSWLALTKNALLSFFTFSNCLAIFLSL